jgi:N-glycosidase YbiA
MTDPKAATTAAELVERVREIAQRGDGWIPVEDAETLQFAADEIARLAEVEKLESPGCHGLDTPGRVRFYEHDFYVLSNFSAFCLHWRGHAHFTSEHAYHWARFDYPAGVLLQDCVQRSGSAHEAFKFAQENKSKQREDWDFIKVDVMREILRAKADQHEYVRRKLLATSDRELVEDSWRDDFWGWGPNRDGKNMLGKLWMEVRAEIRAARALVPAAAKGEAK